MQAVSFSLQAYSNPKSSHGSGGELIPTPPKKIDS